MIEIDQLDSTIESLRPQFVDFDNHVIRLHLMAYSVKEMIDRLNNQYDPAELDSEENALYEDDLNLIPHGYYGLLRYEIVRLMEERDPLKIKNLPDDRTDDLHNLLRFQVSEFQNKPREPVYYYEYEGLKDLVNELSFTDPEAVYLRPPRVKPVGFDKIFSIDEEKYVIDYSRLSIDSYKRYSDYLITEFYKGDQFLRPDEILDHMLDGLQLQDINSINCINIGVGNVLWTLRKKYPDTDLNKGVVIQSRNICESFLCAVNLWPLTWYLREPYIKFDNPFEEREKEVVEKKRPWPGPYDLTLGVVSEHEFLEKSLNPDIFTISHDSTEVENQYIELLLAKLSESGQASIAVPERYLYSSHSRPSREFYLNKGWISRIKEVPQENAGNSFGKMVIIHFDRSNPVSEMHRISFRSGTETTSWTIEEIREKNPQLDLRPSRFLDSVEYEYRDIFELFEKGHLDKNLKGDLVTILSSLTDGSVFKNNFNPSRNILEAIYRQLFLTEKPLPESELFFDQQDRINLERCWRYLSGMGVQRDKHGSSLLKRQGGERFPPHVKDCAKMCQGLTNKNSHYYEGDATLYEYRAAVNALLVTLDWFRKEMTVRESSQ